ncbi:hypothetical protein CLU83_0130 [Flavobacterium sp. 1]|uniref:hypothetical protein n=1 Tax=Flavobacterium sp. 1 TaxID=2035200 RepID=UPI000C233014|nr:hypothetical protein [Flavobacterium sp. 1]PJJ07002.1 hypothetical protein CLU83_0130 [Flavobacterium sp. 1]
MRKFLTSLKNNPAILFSFVFIFLVSLNAKSQTVKYDSVNKQKYILVDVQKTYERIVDKGYESAEIFESLGNYYYENNNLKKSKLYFDKLFGKYSISQISLKSRERYQLMKK